MNKLIAITSVVVLSLSVFEVAATDMKTKIAMKEAESTFETAKDQVVKGCGNTKLEVAVDWSNYSKYDYAKMRTQSEKIVRFTGGLVNKLFEDLSEICTEDKYASMYKEELSKISLINISGQTDQNERDATFQLKDDGKTLNMSLNASSTYSSKYADMLKALW